MLPNVSGKSWAFMSDKVLAQVIIVVVDSKLFTGPKHYPLPRTYNNPTTRGLPWVQVESLFFYKTFFVVKNYLQSSPAS